MEKMFLSVKEFAIKVGMDEQTIRRSIKNGRIQAFKVGSGEKSAWRIHESELHRLGLFDLKKIVKKINEELQKEETE